MTKTLTALLLLWLLPAALLAVPADGDSLPRADGARPTSKLITPLPTGEGLVGGEACASSGAGLAVFHALSARGVTFSIDNSVTLLTDGQQKFDDLFRAIEQAQSTIHLEYFNFRNDSINRELVSRLAERAAHGVKVRAIFDGFGNASNNQPMRRRHIEAMRAQGIDIHEFKPLRFPWIDAVFNRDHRKIVVIDGQVAYTGGMNVADYYIKGTREVGEWHDLHCRIEGTEVNTLQRIFVRMWQKVTGEQLSEPGLYMGGLAEPHFQGLKPDTTATRGHKLVGIINREPHTSRAIIRDFYLEAINAARDSIKLINPYFTLSPRLKRAFRRAARRGVKVEIMLSAKSDIPLTPDCGYYNAHRLMRHGCDVWIFEPGFHHTKIIMVDGEVATVGSANLNARSLRFDREENAVVLDTCTTRQLDTLFEQQKARSFRLTEDRWDQWRTPWKKFVGWFAHLLAPFL